MMAYMTWSSDFSVGVAQFDKEHRLMMDIVNDMHEHVRNGTTDEALGQFSDKVIAQILTHLIHEEKCFDELHYPRAGTHKALHENLRTRIKAMRGEIGHKDCTVLATEMLQFFRETLLQHIQDEDKDYGAYLNDQGVS